MSPPARGVLLLSRIHVKVSCIGSYAGLFSQTFTPDTNTLLWPVDAAIGDAVSFIVVDSANVTSAGGPFNVVTSSVTSCLGGNDLLSDITGGLLKRAESIDIELRSMGPPAVLDDRRSGSAWSLRRPGPLRRARRRAARIIPHSSP
ncbi:hypothetical protein DL93DRAFT_2071666 [Clavulina sp. PMI_390]|nr:hypothetical protein DL93DRAFT_2071666 [Clavulina sp. PMI_390]